MKAGLTSLHRTLLVVAVLAMVMFAGCVSRSQEGDSDVMILGDPATSGLSDRPGPIQAPLETYDLDGDGRQEIIAHSSDTNVYVFDSGSGKALAKLRMPYPTSWHVQQVSNGPAVGVLEPGQAPTIVVANHAAYVTAWRLVPEESGSSGFTFEKAWEHRMSECRKSPSMDASAVLSDVDDDGALEILIQTEEVGLFVLESDGTTKWSQCWAGGHSAPVAADLEGDGDMEAVFASDSGFISVFDAATGAPQWTFDSRDPRYGIHPASVTVTPTVADLDGEYPLEIVYTARHAPEDDPEKYGEFNMGIFAIRQNLTTWKSELVWLRQPEWANPMAYSRLIVRDVDQDGRADIFGVDWNTIGHRPGAWEHLGPANAFRLDADGQDVWVREVDSWWSNKDVALGDPDGDGGLELLVNGPKGGVDGLWRLSADTGSAEGMIGAEGWKMLGSPVLADLRGDGQMQLAYAVTPDDGDDEVGGIAVIDLDVPYEAHDFHGPNVEPQGEAIS